MGIRNGFCTAGVGKPKPRKRYAFAALFLSVLVSACAGQPSPALTLAPHVDLDRYMGRWYVIGHIPYWAERNAVASYDFYEKRPDGTLANVFNYHDKTVDAPLKQVAGHAYVVADTGNAKWRVSFLWPIYISYLILYVDPSYHDAVIGYSDKSLGWVLSRDPTMDETTYRGLLAKFAAQGYDTTQFRRVAQTAGEIGTPGYEEVAK